jgi:hypothetical protein
MEMVHFCKLLTVILKNFPIMSFKTEPKILGRGWSAIVFWYDKDSVLKSHQVWFEGRCRRCITPDDSSRLAPAREDAVYQRLGFHPHILRYYGRVEVATGACMSPISDLVETPPMRLAALQKETKGVLTSTVRQRLRGISPEGGLQMSTV